MALLDFIVIPLVIFTGHQIVDWVVHHYQLPSQKRLLIRLFYYHFAFSLIYGIYVNIYGGDSVGYWRYPARFLPQGLGWIDLHVPGTRFIYFLTLPLSQWLKVSFWGGTAIFSLFGFVGFILIFLTLRQGLKVNPRLFGYQMFPFILFLPNVHFWSAGIGKDSIMFFSLSLFIYCLTNPVRNIPGLILSFYLAYFTRPHMALLMSVGFAFSLLLSARGVSFFFRVVFLGLSVYTFVLISPAVFEFIGVEEENIESYEDLASIRSKNLSRANVGSAIDIRDYSVPLKLFTFLFRPLFFDAGSVLGMIVSVENLFYLVLALTLLRLRNLLEIITMPMHLKAGLFVLASTTFFMSSSLSNLGIIIRQKNMVMFIFILITTYLLGKYQESRTVTFRRTLLTRPYAKAKVA